MSGTALLQHGNDTIKKVMETVLHMMSQNVWKQAGDMDRNDILAQIGNLVVEAPSV